jgi:hypothetical protein
MHSFKTKKNDNLSMKAIVLLLIAAVLIAGCTNQVSTQNRSQNVSEYKNGTINNSAEIQNHAKQDLIKQGEELGKLAESVTNSGRKRATLEAWSLSSVTIRNVGSMPIDLSTEIKFLVRGTQVACNPALAGLLDEGKIIDCMFSGVTCNKGDEIRVESPGTVDFAKC